MNDIFTAFLPCRYIYYLLGAGHGRGRGVHPPFAYGFIREAFFGDSPKGLENAEIIRKQMNSDKRIIDAEGMGAGSRTGLKNRRMVRDLVRGTAISGRYGRVLARMISYLKPDVVIELGTGTGIASLYMHLADPDIPLITCEGSESIAGIAKENFDKTGIRGIELQRGKFESLLPGLLKRVSGELLLFIDGDHREESLLKHFDVLLESGISPITLVIDDINWSKGMNRAWKILRKHPSIALSVETFRIGILMTGREIQKGHFVIKY